MGIIYGNNIGALISEYRLLELKWLPYSKIYSEVYQSKNTSRRTKHFFGTFFRKDRAALKKIWKEYIFVV